jgi:ribonuclease P/MRP protein subunit RPP38
MASVEGGGKRSKTLDGTPRANVSGNAMSLANVAARENSAPKPARDKAKRLVLKTYLDSPFHLPLPVCDSVSASTLSAALTSIRPLVHREAADTRKQPGQAKQAADSHTSATHAFTRQILFVGINEVTRALEHDEASTVVLCASIRPAHVTQHVPILCYQRRVPLCCASNMSAFLADLLGLKTVGAIAFRRQLLCSPDRLQEIQKVVQTVSACVSPFSASWLPKLPKLTSSSSSGPTQPHAYLPPVVKRVQSSQPKLPGKAKA